MKPECTYHLVSAFQDSASVNFPCFVTHGSSTHFKHYKTQKWSKVPVKKNQCLSQKGKWLYNKQIMRIMKWLELIGAETAVFKFLISMWFGLEQSIPKDILVQFSEGFTSGVLVLITKWATDFTLLLNGCCEWFLHLRQYQIRRLVFSLWTQCPLKSSKLLTLDSLS